MEERQFLSRYGVPLRDAEDILSGLDAVTKAARRCGPLDEKTVLLIQLGAAAATGSKRAVACLARAASMVGATPEAVNQSLLALTTVIGYPAVASALKWAHLHLDEG